MRGRFIWLIVLGLGLCFATLPLGAWADEGAKPDPALATEEKKAERPQPTQEALATSAKSTMAEKPTGLMGTIVAVVPETQTLVVDVPLGSEVLRVGAVATDTTKIRSAGKTASFASLKEGARVRLNFRRVDTGDEAISVHVLRGSQG